MINALLPLEQAVCNYCEKRSPEPTDGSAQTILEAAKQVGFEAAMLYRQYASLELARTGFQHYHRKIISLNDRLYRYAQGCPTTSGIYATLDAVQSLLSDQENMYRELISLNAALPLHHYDRLKALVADTLSPLLAKLAHKAIHPPFLNEIQYAMDSLFSEAKLPQPAYYHLWYIPMLLKALEQMADDTRTKDWPLRFIGLMVRYNFNHMGFFNRWCEQQESILDEAVKNSCAQETLGRTLSVLNHYRAPENVAYDSSHDSLVAHMRLFFTDKRKWLKQLNRREPPSEALETRLNSEEQTIRFHYSYKLNYYDYPSKREAARAFSRVHRSKTGKHISAHTLEKLDKVELYDAALWYRRDRLKIIHYLEKDFGIK